MIKQEIKMEDNGLIDRLDQYPEIVAEENRVFLDTALAYIVRIIKAVTPVGVTGHLRGSIFPEIYGIGANLTGIVGTPSPYAESIEGGTRPHWAPIEPLKLWAMRKLGNERLAYAIRAKIARKGTKGHFMFKKAFEQAQRFVREQHQVLTDRIRNRINGG